MDIIERAKCQPPLLDSEREGESGMRLEPLWSGLGWDGMVVWRVVAASLCGGLVASGTKRRGRTLREMEGGCPERERGLAMSFRNYFVSAEPLLLCPALSDHSYTWSSKKPLLSAVTNVPSGLIGCASAALG